MNFLRVLPYLWPFLKSLLEGDPKDPNKKKLSPSLVFLLVLLLLIGNTLSSMMSTPDGVKLMESFFKKGKSSNQTDVVPKSTLTEALTALDKEKATTKQLSEQILTYKQKCENTNGKVPPVTLPSLSELAAKELSIMEQDETSQNEE